MGAETSQFPSQDGWTIDRAETLLATLPGVLSARLVARPGGQIDEIHLLTTEEVSPKQTVRNVESALLAHFDLSVDHRKISVAQSQEKGVAEAVSEEAPGPAPAREAPEERILFLGHQAESESSRLKAQVSVEWRGERFSGEAVGADLTRSRLETLANATLRAVEEAVGPEISDQGGEGVALALDGVTMLDAFDRGFVLVAVHALRGRNVTALAGAAGIDDSPDRAVILATLQATDRWLRGRVR